ncbi:rhomboid family intramembrane serine protease [Roseovarius salinarum]|uniref:rhomboid family intramembrane serine protease n=1 Tax=Roseovarius salinarum TaxID=1981892 RepID=UPI000C31FDD8|nr:rhomboid family intramembrane serine protease [Roseovarius salinarum]
MTPPEPQHPVNPLPPVIAALFLVIMGIETAFMLGSRGIVGGPEAVGWRQGAIQAFGFNADVMDWMLVNGVYPAEHVIRFVSYAFVHGTFTHAIFAGVLLLALGKFVGEVFSQLATLSVFVVSTVVGAVVYGFVAAGQPWLIGAFPGVYGLIGGFTYILWQRLGQMGAQQSRAFTLIAVLLGIQLVFGLIFGGSRDWVADVAGFAAGFALSFFVSPGGWQRMRAMIRHR